MALKKKSKSLPLSLKNKRAFTLVEVLISMALVAGIIVLVASRFSSSKNEIKSDLTQLMVMTKKSFQYAQIKSATYRIVFDMTETDEEGNPKQHRFWTEYANGPKFIPDPEEKQKLDEEGKPISDFKIDERINKKPRVLPDGYKFTSISYGGRDEIDSGVAYIYFFPQGYTEESLIQLAHEENKHYWSILIDPLTGISSLIPKQVNLKDLKQGK